MTYKGLFDSAGRVCERYFVIANERTASVTKTASRS